MKIHRSYTVTDIVRVLGVHPNTALHWIRGGLPTIDRSRPFMVQGRALKEFLSKRERDRKQPCAQDEMYCLRCRAPRKWLAESAARRQFGAHDVRLFGNCSVCGTVMYRRLPRCASEPDPQRSPLT